MNKMSVGYRRQRYRNEQHVCRIWAGKIAKVVVVEAVALPTERVRVGPAAAPRRVVPRRAVDEATSRRRTRSLSTISVYAVISSVIRPIKTMKPANPGPFSYKYE